MTASTTEAALRGALAATIRAAEMSDRFAGETADALLAGPLAPLLADISAVKAALDKHEPLIPRLSACVPSMSLGERVAAIAREAVDARESERRLSERAGITLGVTATDDPAVLIDTLRASAVRIDRLSAALATARAESEALRARVERAEAALKPFAEYARLTEEAGLNIGPGEMGEFIYGGLRRSIHTRDLEAARSALAQPEQEGQTR